MNKTAVIFHSKTGFTQKYARWISEEINADMISLKNCDKKRAEEILREYDNIIFGSRLKAGLIEKLPKAKKLFGGGKRFIIFTTGASPSEAKETEATLKKMWEQNLSAEELERIPHFYMQAGLCYEKMPFFEKTMMKAFTSMMKKKKDGGIGSEAESALESSYDISDKKYIKPLTEYISCL